MVRFPPRWAASLRCRAPRRQPVRAIEGPRERGWGGLGTGRERPERWRIRCSVPGPRARWSRRAPAPRSRRASRPAPDRSPSAWAPPERHRPGPARRSAFFTSSPQSAPEGTIGLPQENDRTPCGIGYPGWPLAGGATQFDRPLDSDGPPLAVGRADPRSVPAQRLGENRPASRPARLPVAPGEFPACSLR